MASPEEQRLRRSLAKYGFRLVKSKRRADPTTDDRGGYDVMRVSTGHFIAGADFSLDLEDAMAVIIMIRKGEFDLTPGRMHGLPRPIRASRRAGPSYVLLDKLLLPQPEGWSTFGRRLTCRKLALSEST